MTETIDRTYVTELDVDGIVSEHGSVVVLNEDGESIRYEVVGDIYRRPIYQVLTDLICDESMDHDICIGHDAMTICWDIADEQGQDVLL